MARTIRFARMLPLVVIVLAPTLLAATFPLPPSWALGKVCTPYIDRCSGQHDTSGGGMGVWSCVDPSCSNASTCITDVQTIMGVVNPPGLPPGTYDRTEYDCDCATEPAKRCSLKLTQYTQGGVLKGTFYICWPEECTT